MHPSGILYLHKIRKPLLHILGQGLLVLVLLLIHVCVLFYNPITSKLFVIILVALLWLSLSVWAFISLRYALPLEIETIFPFSYKDASARLWKLGTILFLWQCISISWQEYTQSFPQAQQKPYLDMLREAPLATVCYSQAFLPEAYQKALRIHTYDLLKLYKILGQSDSLILDQPQSQWQIDSLYQSLLLFRQKIDTLTQGNPDTTGIVQDSLIRQDTLHHLLLVYFLESNVRASLTDSSQLENLSALMEDTLQTPGLLYPTLQQLLRYHQGLEALHMGEFLRDSLIRVMLEENFHRQIRKVARSQYLLMRAQSPQSFPRARKWIPKED